MSRAWVEDRGHLTVGELRRWLNENRVNDYMPVAFRTKNGKTRACGKTGFDQRGTTILVVIGELT